MILNSLDGAAIAGRNAIVARLRLIDAEWTDVVYDDPRAISSAAGLPALAQQTGADFVAMVLVSDLDTDPAADNGRAFRTYEYLVMLGQPYGEGAGVDEFIGRVEKMENRLGSAPFSVTLGSDTFEMAVAGMESAEPIAPAVDENGTEIIGVTKATTVLLAVEVCA